MKPIRTGRRDLLKSVAAFSASATASTLFGLTPKTAWAERYPSRPVRLVIPYTPGGGTDLVGRVLAEGISQAIGQPVIVENKPGAGTIIGSEMVAKSPPDGYTLLLNTGAHAINASLIKSLPYSTEKSFESIALVCRGPNMLVTRADSPFKTVKDVIDYARANPGKLNYGSSGNGTAVHLAGELFKMMAKVNIVHIPYRGGGPAYTDLLGGQIDLVFGTAAGVGKYVSSGRMNALAVTSAERSPSWPQVPTIAESGVPGYVADVWYAVFAAGGTPADIVAVLNDAVRKTSQADLFHTRVENEGLVAAVGTPQDLTRFVNAEIQRWREVVEAGNIHIN